MAGMWFGDGWAQAEDRMVHRADPQDRRGHGGGELYILQFEETSAR
jgi:hypothetical protein